MAYRETDKVKHRKAATRENVLAAAQAVVAEAGFHAVQMSHIAERAGVATGTLYRYFPSKENLCTEVFRLATEIEVAKVRAVLSEPVPAAQRIYNALQVFAERALRAPTMAWALIAEPVEPAVDQARLDYRAEYAKLFAAAIEQAIHEGTFPPQPPELMSTALVGAIAEALIGPLSPYGHAGTHTNQSNPITPILTFLMQALSGQPLAQLSLTVPVASSSDKAAGPSLGVVHE